MDMGNQDLAVLIGYKLKSNRDASLRFACLVQDSENISKAEEHLKRLAGLARIPDAEVWVRKGTPKDMANTPEADLNIIPMPGEKADFKRLREMVDQLATPAIFTLDSGEESALA
jgi:solute carrier family 12 (sodium/potassium/chloride transporter), member 2